jgi:TrmH family RNA methyltransferase
VSDPASEAQWRPGQVRRIDAPSNPLIKRVRGLALKKHRDESGEFLAEGLKLLTDALDGGWPVRLALYAAESAAEPAVAAAAARARAGGAMIVEASARVMGAIARRDNPQNVMAVFAQRWCDAASIRPAVGDLWIALDRVRDPGNLGTIVRTADCVGASGVMLVGETTDPFSLEAVRATMGSVFHVPLARLGREEFVAWRKDWPGLVAGTHLQGSVDYRTPEWRGRAVLLLMGNEQRGLPDELAGTCDVLCRIPMAGRADSLNLAVATALMAYEVRRHALGGGEAAR